MTQDFFAILTFVLSAIGVLSWLPDVVRLLKRQKLYGKIISKYNNINSSRTLFLFKLSILFKNRDFYLKDITCIIELDNGRKFESKALNMRKITFNKNEELLVVGKDFINNYSILPHDRNIEGYLYCEFEVSNPSMKVASYDFVFRSYNNMTKKIRFEESKLNSRLLFYDDSIWRISS